MFTVLAYPRARLRGEIHYVNLTHSLLLFHLKPSTMNTTGFINHLTGLVLIASLTLFSCKKKTSEGKSSPAGQEVQMKDSIITTQVPVRIDSLHLVDTLTNLSELQVIAGDELFPLSQTLLFQTAQSLEGFDYLPKKIQDCSGMFIRYLRALRKASTPALMIPDPDLVLPEPNLPNSEYKDLRFSVRSSRQFGKWYADRGQFIPVHPEDIEQKAYRDMIKPGMVLFYGYKQIKKKKKYNLSDMKPINHMGVVVNVIKEGDDIVRYQLFHGRNDRKEDGKLINPSAITGVGDQRGYRVHERRYPTGPGFESFTKFPSLGFGPQHWIGIAPIANNLGRYEITRDTIEIQVATR